MPHATDRTIAELADEARRLAIAADLLAAHVTAHVGRIAATDATAARGRLEDLAALLGCVEVRGAGQ